MKIRKKWVFTGVTCALAALFLWAVWSVGEKAGDFGFKALRQGTGDADFHRYTYEYTWDPEEISVRGLKIDWVHGGVEVKSTGGAVIRITEQANRPLTEEENLEYKRSGGALAIQWNGLPSVLGRFDDLEKSLVVEVPAGLAGEMELLSCKNRSGNIQIGGGFTAGKIEVSSASGSLAASGLTGETGSFSTLSGGLSLQGINCQEALRASTAAGKLEASGLSAEELTLITVSGGVSAESVQAEELRVKSISGPVWVRLGGSPKEAALESVSGDLRLGMPGSIGDFTAEYNGISGGFSTDFLTDRRLGRSGSVAVGDGSAKLRFTTTSGVMRVEKQAAAAP